MNNEIQTIFEGFTVGGKVIPVAFMTGITWVRYGLNVKQDYTGSLEMIVNSGVSQKIAEIVIVACPILGCILLAFASMQLYRGIKSKDLFI